MHSAVGREGYLLPGVRVADGQARRVQAQPGVQVLHCCPYVGVGAEGGGGGGTGQAQTS